MVNTRALFIGAILNSSWHGGETNIAKNVIHEFIERQVSVKETGYLRSGFFHSFNSLVNPLDLNPIYFKRYLKIMHNFHPNIVFSWFDYDTSSLAASITLKVPTVAAVHIHWPMCPLITLWNNGSCIGPSKERCNTHIIFQRHPIYKVCSFNGQSLQSSLRTRIKRLNSIEAVIVPSNFMKTKLIEQGVRSEQIQVIYNGINLQKTKNQRETKEKSKATKTKNVLYLGSTIEQKGFLDFVKMAKMLKGRYNARFLAVGHDMSIDPVQALGYLDKESLDAVLEEAYVVVFPSLWDEPFGLVPIEAMAMRKPVVAYSVGAVPETINDGVTGFLAPKGRFDMLAEKVEELLADEALAEEMGNNGRRVVEEKFDLAVMVDKYYVLMKKIVG